MKRLMTFVCALVVVGACSKSPAVQAAAADKTLVASKSAPAEATADKSAPTEATPDKSAPAAAGGPADSPAEVTPGDAIKKVSAARPDYREVTLPAGTVLPVTLETSVGSDTSRVEQPVSGRLRRAVTVGGAQVLPAGTVVNGHVTAAQRPGKVKGRGMIAMRFTQLDTPGAGRTAISSATISRLAPATKEKDALEIIGPAAAGAVIGRLAGGKGAARKGAVIGGGAGAGYVLATRGKDVRMGRGAPLSVRLTAPVTFRVAR
jgi:hypothetical protein